MTLQTYTYDEDYGTITRSVNGVPIDFVRYEGKGVTPVDDDEYWWGR